jgi:hypothetical protein
MKVNITRMIKNREHIYRQTMQVQQLQANDNKRIRVSGHSVLLLKLVEDHFEITLYTRKIIT